MSRKRSTMEGRRHLVLLRGGLDADDDGGADWQGFCQRIGWQAAAPAPADDLEERLLSRLFPPPSNVVSVDFGAAARENEAAEARFAPAAEAEPGASRWGRVVVAAAASLAVAAIVLLLVAKAFSPRSSAQAASLPEPSADIARTATPNALPRDVEPDPRAPRVDAPTAKPSPGPRPPRDSRPRPPGVRLATGPSEPENGPYAHDPQVFATGNMAVPDLRLTDPLEEPGAAAGSMAVLDLPAVARADAAPASADGPVGWGSSMHDRVVVPPAGSVALAPAPVRPSTRVWSSNDPAATPEPVRSASWSLSPENGRWFGATMAPPPPRDAATASIGVMAQLDVVKAIDRL